MCKYDNILSMYNNHNQVWINKIRSLYLNVSLIGVVFCFIIILLFNYFEPNIKLFLTTYISKDFIYYEDYLIQLISISLKLKETDILSSLVLLTYTQ